MIERPTLWWKEKDSDTAAQQAIEAVHNLVQHGGSRIQDLEAWESIYNDDHCDFFEDVGYQREGKSRMPVLPGMADATLSRIGRARPLPMVLTTDGDWALKQKAKKKGRWLAGMFKKLGVHDVTRDVLQDAIVLGTGAPKIYYDEEAEEIRVEQTWIGELWVENAEAKRNCVRTLYQAMAVDRQALLDTYPKFQREIEAAPVHVTDEDYSGQTDMVEIVECWRIGTKKTPGRHMIAIEEKAILDEKWEKKRFPFEFLHWRKRQRRFWGQGMVESGAGLQSMINDTAQTMEENFRLTFPAIFYQKGSGFRAESLTNEGWCAYEYEGTPPTFTTPPPFSDSYYKYLQTLRSSLFETQGVSELAASSHKPAGLNSGKALLVFQDVESERFLIQGRAFEELHVRIAERIIEIAEDLVKTKGKAEALRALGGKKGLEAIDFKDVRFGDKPWEIQVYPVTSLSHSPSGRLEQIQELLQMGVITDPAVARELLDYPDLERYTSVESARRELAEKLIDEAIDKGEVKPANPYMDLQYALKRGALVHNLAELEGAPEDHLDALRNFIGSVESLIADEKAKAQAEAQAMQAQAGAMAPQPPQPQPPPGGAPPADLMAPGAA